MFYFSLNTAQDMTIFEKINAWYEASVVHELLMYLWQTYFTVSFGAYENFQLSPNAGEFARSVIFALAIALVVASALAVYTKKWVGAFVRTLIRDEIHSPKQAKTLFELGFFRSFAVRRELKYGVQLRKLIRCREREERMPTPTHAESAEDATAGTTVAENVAAETTVAENVQKEAVNAESAPAEVAGLEATLTEDVLAEKTITENAPAETTVDGEVLAETAARGNGIDTESISSGEGEQKEQKTFDKSGPRYLADALEGFDLDFKTAHFYLPIELREHAEVRYEKKGFGWLQVVLTAVAAVLASALLCYFLPDLVQLADNIISMMSPQ